MKKDEQSRFPGGIIVEEEEGHEEMVREPSQEPQLEPSVGEDEEGKDEGDDGEQKEIDKLEEMLKQKRDALKKKSGEKAVKKKSVDKGGVATGSKVAVSKGTKRTLADVANTTSKSVNKRKK